MAPLPIPVANDNNRLLISMSLIIWQYECSSGSSDSLLFSWYAEAAWEDRDLVSQAASQLAAFPQPPQESRGSHTASSHRIPLTLHIWWTQASACWRGKVKEQFLYMIKKCFRSWSLAWKLSYRYRTFFGVPVDKFGKYLYQHDSYKTRNSVFFTKKILVRRSLTKFL
jgi:hypothetical protein